MNRTAVLLSLLFLAGCERSASPPPGAGARADAAADSIAASAPASPAAAPAPDAVADPATAPATDPAFTLPGDFAESTTLADLQARYGAHYVKVEESPQDDGSIRRQVILFPDEPARRATVEFHDAEAMQGVASISVRDTGSIWRGKGGVRIGMTVAELRQANGGPFYLSGFDADGRAWVRDQWSPALDDDAGLGALDVGTGDHMYFGVDLGLRDGVAAVPADAYPRDDSILSDDPRYPRLVEIAVVTALVASTSLDDEWE